MSTPDPHMFSLDEAAVAYAVAAEHMFGNDATFLNNNPAVVPVFVSMLFQSLEISIKHAGIESGLFTMQEARNRQNRSGHGVKELAALAVDKLGGDPFGSHRNGHDFLELKRPLRAVYSRDDLRGGPGENEEFVRITVSGIWRNTRGRLCDHKPCCRVDWCRQADGH